MDLPKRPSPKLVAPPPQTVVVRRDDAPAPAVEYRGVWRSNDLYARGDAVTYGGQLWIAASDSATGKSPGQCPDWKLAVKRGRDGMDGESGEVGPMPKHEWDGTKIRFQQGPDGSQWGKWIDIQGPPGRDGVGGVIIKETTATLSGSYFPAGW